MTLKALVPMVYVKDVRKSADFYRNTLDFRMTGSYEPGGKLCWAYLKSGEADLMLTLGEGAARVGGGCIYYYYTDDVLALATHLRGKGVQISEPFVTFYGMKEICFKDPDGNELTVGQHTDEAPSDGAELAADLREHK